MDVFCGTLNNSVNKTEKKLHTELKTKPTSSVKEWFAEKFEKVIIFKQQVQS